jgi:DNA ligase-associated metallophosphoesterase
MHRLTVLDHSLNLLPEKAIYLENLKALLVSDVHLGKSETFQSVGVPIPTTVNQTTLNRLSQLCANYDLEYVFILGDLFHSRSALVPEVLDPWFQFIESIDASVQLIVGNHDRALVPKLEQLSISCILDTFQVDTLILSHEPVVKPSCLTICGHIHPCIRIKSKLDTLRLPCFYLDQTQNLLVLPSFGEFTGGYDIDLTGDIVAYAIAENQIIPFAAQRSGRKVKKTKRDR